MSLHSVKSRFLGSYGFLVFLFLVQLPIIYLLVGSMSEKYAQVETAESLKARAIELNYVLNRHIMNGEEELEQVFQNQKREFGSVISSFKTGSADLAAIKDADTLVKLEKVEGAWENLRTAMDDSMHSGDTLVEVVTELENETYPMVSKLNNIVQGFVALNDTSYGKSIDLAGLQRMRTVNLAYLMERYARSNFDLDFVADNINNTIKDFENTFNGLRFGSASLALKAVHNTALLDRFTDAEALWNKRKALITEAIKAKDSYQASIMGLANEHIPAMVKASEELTGQITANAHAGAVKGLAVMALSLFLSITVAVFFMWSANTQIIRPITRIKETVEAIANGVLTRRSGVKVSFFGRELDDEITALGKSVDTMADQMCGVIGRITDSSNLLASASEQLSTSSTQITDGAERQSSQTTQVATAMEEMSATVIEVAKNSQQASESARNAQEIATNGGDVVAQAIAAMKEVAESTQITAETIKKLGNSSEEIGTIISVINDIADQTNLLALNAAIEAARAGEQGRGFAVVADEVRKLAERTTKATKEISSMINTIQTETSTAVDAMAEGTQKVENGVNLANQTGDSLRQIVSGVERVTDMISHIATSAEEQSATTEEITQNIDSIAEAAQTNVTAIGEVANASNELARLATELKEVVSGFTIEKVSDTARFSGVENIDDWRSRANTGSDSLRRAG